MTKKKPKPKKTVQSLENNKTNNKKRHPPNCRCKFCGATFKTTDKKSEHERNCDGRKAANVFITLDGKAKFLCKVCNQLFKYQSGLKKHELRHDPPGGFLCSECNQRFLTDIERALHKETIHKLFKCFICEQKFTSESEYGLHIDDKHDGKDREYVVCADCGAQFRQPNQLRLHNESKCGTIRCFSCEQCGSKFMTQNTLNAHLLIHVGEKKYLCNFCGNSYLSRGQLKVHERSHTGEKPFKCSICGKSFAHRESLVTHSSLHTGVKPYVCENCGSRFSCIGNLIKHRRARPHSCGLPQFNKNTKCAPRASSKNNGSLTMKRAGATKQNYADRKPTQPNDLLLSDSIDESDTVQNNTPTISLSISKLKIEPSPNANNSLFEKEEIDEEVEDELDEEVLSTKGEEMRQVENEINAYDGDFINFEVSTVDDINEYAIDGNWQTEHQVQEISANEIFGTNGTTITYNVSDVVVVIKNDEQLIGEQEYIITSYDESKLNGVDVGVAIPADDIDDLQTAAEVVICNNFNITNVDDTNNINANARAGPEIRDEIENHDKDGKFRVTYTVADSTIDINHIDKNDDDDDDDIEYEPSDNEITENENKTVIRNERTSIDDEDDDVKMFQCDECPGQFRYRRSYLKHMDQYHNKNESGISFANRRTSKKATFSCKYCEKKYTSDKLLKKHAENHGPDGTLTHRCTCCPLYFATADETQKHQIEMHKEKLTCSYCNKMFKDPECVGAHVRYVHTKKAAPPKKYIYVCTKCGKKFNSRVAMSDHERADCGRSPIYKCNSCDKFYHSAGSLKTHQLIHSGVLLHLCNYCGKAFRTQGQVKVHERSHNGDKPFKCEFCPKSFGHRESLLTHLSLHTGIKRFMCQGCHSRFSCISNLQAHRRSHKTTCGQLPNMTRPVGPMGDEKFSACATKTNSVENVQ